MANRIIAEEGWGKVNYGRDIPQRFFEEGHIDQDLQSRWVRMIGFRNILVY